MVHKKPILDEDRMYRALVESDSSFEGIFFVGVRTTGVFCRPSCHARKPRRENVRFYPTARAALLDGYRPCQLCRPMEPAGEAPEWLRPLIAEVHQNPDSRINDHHLREKGLDPARVRRWFKKHHGLTFHGYQRAIRISRAFGTMKRGEKVVKTAFDAGYESLSGFTASFRRLTGVAPSDSEQAALVVLTRLVTPLGPMVAGAAESGICLLEFVDRRMLETQLKRLSQLFGARLLPGESPFFEALQQQLDQYFTGSRTAFTVPLEVRGTDFQQEVWGELTRIPYGATRSYRQQAEALGKPAAVRAVARANGDNRIAILIPCHRVIGSDGSLTGYGGGLERKRYLLELEGGGSGLLPPSDQGQ